MAKEHEDDVEPPEFVMSSEEERILLPSENLDPELLAEGTILSADVEGAALRVIGGEFGSSETAQRRKLIRAGFKPGAVMAEVKRLSS